MKKPDPTPGLVVNYDYLWRDEHLNGRREGGKFRTCAVVAASTLDKNGDRTVYLCAIGHEPPNNAADALKITPRMRKSAAWMIVDNG